VVVAVCSAAIIIPAAALVATRAVILAAAMAVALMPAAAFMAAMLAVVRNTKLWSVVFGFQTKLRNKFPIR
jgi:hypothetical protein